MAGRIPAQFIDDLLTRVDVVEVIDARVPLKKAGKNLQACCPFHNEKTPSFTVSRDKQFYHCFGCGAHGSAISFLMEYEQLSFPESIQELAESVGLPVPTEAVKNAQPNQKTLYDLLEKISQYFSHQLQNHAQHAKFQDYIVQRGLSATTVEAFQIGMAPEGWDNVLRTFGSDAAATAQLDKAGLLSHNDSGKTYDRFRDRLMFPIHDRRGRVVGFGGRVLDDSRPKYLNSPETPVFHKSQELYGFYRARKINRDLPQIIIVEGYMDVVMLAEYGINHAVATLGTATTSEHLRLLIRTAPDIVFCFDGDRAGREAAWRAAENSLPLLGGEAQLRFLFLPDGTDPDSIVRDEGMDAFLARAAAAQPFSGFLFSTLMARVDMETIEGRARLVELMKPYFQKVPKNAYRELLEQELAERAKTTIGQLKQHLPDAAEVQKIEQATGQNRRASTAQNKAPSAMRTAITILLQYPALAAEVLTNVALPTLATLENAGTPILVGLLEKLTHKPKLHTAALLENWRDSPHERSVQRLAMQELMLEPEKLLPELKDCLARLQADAQQARQTILSSKPLSALTAEEKVELQAILQKQP